MAKEPALNLSVKLELPAEAGRTLASLQQGLDRLGTKVWADGFFQGLLLGAVLILALLWRRDR